MRIMDMITQDESNWYFNKFSPLHLLKTCRDNKKEFEFWCEGLKGWSPKIDQDQFFRNMTLNIIN